MSRQQWTEQRLADAIADIDEMMQANDRHLTERHMRRIAESTLEQRHRLERQQQRLMQLRRSFAQQLRLLRRRTSASVPADRRNPSPLAGPYTAE